jgi:hypothetical protein
MTPRTLAIRALDHAARNRRAAMLATLRPDLAADTRAHYLATALGWLLEARYYGRGTLTWD